MKGFSDVNVCFLIKRSAGLLTACSRLRRLHSSWWKKEKPNQSWHSVKDNTKTDRAVYARINFSLTWIIFFFYIPLLWRSFSAKEIFIQRGNTEWPASKILLTWVCKFLSPQMRSKNWVLVKSIPELTYKTRAMCPTNHSKAIVYLTNQKVYYKMFPRLLMKHCTRDRFSRVIIRSSIVCDYIKMPGIWTIVIFQLNYKHSFSVAIRAERVCAAVQSNRAVIPTVLDLAKTLT